MIIKSVLKALLLAYGVTGIFLLFLAFLLFQFDPGEKMILAGITVGYFLACLPGGFLAGKLLRKNRYLWGCLTGLGYYLLLLLVSFFVRGKLDMTVSHALTSFLLCLCGGTLGGMLS